MSDWLTQWHDVASFHTCIPNNCNIFLLGTKRAIHFTDYLSYHRVWEQDYIRVGTVQWNVVFLDAKGGYLLIFALHI